MKHTSTKALLLALLLLAGMIVSPVYALGYDIVSLPIGSGVNSTFEKVSNLTLDVSPQGLAIQRIVVDVGSGTAVNFTLWYGNGATVSGWMEYINTGLYQQHSGVAIDTDIQGYDYIGLQEIGRIDIATYARNWTSDTEYTTGFIVYDSVFGVSERRAMAYYPVANTSDNIIYKFVITSSKPVTISWNTNTRDAVATGVSKNVIESAKDWIALAGQYSSSAIGFIAGLFWILKFFFIDNLLLIIVLWISVSMAVSAITTPYRKMPWGFFEKFLKYQKALLDFILSLWTTLWSILNYLVQIFVKWL